MKKIIAIIPVRKGSQRVKNKSIRKFADTNLLDNKIKILLNIKEIDEIILNTDSEIAIEIGKKYNLTIHKREDYYASSECNNSDFFKHIAKNVNTENSILIYSPVTSPFISEKTIRDMIKIYLNNENNYDSVVGCEYIKHHLWFNGKPLNYDPMNAPNTQDLPDVIACNYGCAIIDRDKQIKYKSLVGKNPYFYKLNHFESIDIDEMYDFELAQLLYKNKNIFKK